MYSELSPVGVKIKMSLSKSKVVDDVEVAGNKKGLTGVDEGIHTSKESLSTPAAECDYHCALCHVPISPENVKRCGKCHRRIYCGRKCQTEDWSKENGQMHKQWCGFEYGEEDVGWKIAQIKGKGQGIIALRNFVPKERIMVVSGSLKDMFDLPKKYYANSGRAGALNHACDANAGRWSLMEPDLFGVMVVFAEKEIEAGDEICVSYTWFNDTVGPGREFMSAEWNRNLLKKKWDIVCPSDCFCRSEDLAQELEGLREMRPIIEKIGFDPDAIESDLELVKMLLEKQIVFRYSLANKLELLEIGFRLAVQIKKTLPLAMKYITEICDSRRYISHPLAWFDQKFERRRKEVERMLKGNEAWTSPSGRTNSASRMADDVKRKNMQ